MPATRRATRRRLVDPILVGCAFLLLSVPAVITLRNQGPVNGPDTLWHLVLGHKLRSTWDFGSKDPLSSLTTLPWVYNQWLPEVIASIAQDLGGLPAVAWLASLGRLAILALTWSVCRRRVSALPALAAAIVTWLGTAGAWDARPQLVGIAMCVVAADAALRTVDDGRPRWWLIPFTWVWAMCHGTWVLGVALSLMVAVTGLRDRRGERASAHLARFAVSALSAAASALTPVGPKLYTTLVSINNVSEFIQEWQGVSLRTPVLALTIAAILGVVVGWARRRIPRPSWGRIAILVFGVCCALTYGRTIAVAAVTVAPLFAEVLQSFVPRRANVPTIEAASLVSGIAIALSLSAATLPNVARLPGDAPSGLSPVLSTLPPSVVFDEETLGGWLYWAHPQLTPVFDTRAEVYGRTAIVSYLDTMNVKGGWQARFDATGARFALLEDRSPLATALIEQRGWSVLGKDHGFVLLAR